MEERIITNDHISKFKEHLILEERSRATIEKYLRDVMAFIEYTNAMANAITKEKVIDYKNRLKDDGYKVNSINSMLAGINSLFCYLGWYDLKVKSFKLQKQVFCMEDKELTRKEFDRLINTARANHNDRLCLIMQTICGTGIRVSELQYITVEAARRGEATVYCKGKIRSVFIVRKLQRKILRYAKEHGITSGSIFITRTGKPVSRSNIWRDMKALCRQAHVNPNKVFPHNLRHLFARVFYRVEKDIARLADILGHSSINTTRIYIISTGIEHRRCMERMRLIR